MALLVRVQRRPPTPHATETLGILKVERAILAGFAATHHVLLMVIFFIGKSKPILDCRFPRAWGLFLTLVE
jgi:hypothetical protein